MNGWYKLTEAFIIASLQGEIETLNRTCKALLRDLTSQTVSRSNLERTVQVQAEHILLLYSIVAEPDPPRWHKYGMAFALGMVVMAIFAGVWVSL